MTTGSNSLLNALSQVPGMTLDQAASLLKTTPPRARKLLRALKRTGVVHEARLQVRRVTLLGPLYVSSGLPLTKQEAAELAGLLRSRYGAVTIQSVYSVGRFRRPLQVDHELGVAAVFLWYRAHRPTWTWIGESPLRGARVPDATAFGLEREAIAIDFAGEYRAPKLEAIASYYARRGTIFELW